MFKKKICLNKNLFQTVTLFEDDLLISKIRNSIVIENIFPEKISHDSRKLQKNIIKSIIFRKF